MSVPPSLMRRLGMALLCLVCLIGACFLAWWQWDRYESASGTLQNLGYVLQWPLFGVFPAFMVWRIRKYSRRSEGAEPEGEVPDAAATTAVARQPATVVPSAVAVPRQARSRLAYVPPTAEPEPADDAELAAYNRYLAELNAQQEERNVG